MDFKKKMQKRYAVKKYNSEERLSDSQIEKLKEIVRLSPSSINSQPWNFIFVTNTETKNRLAEFSYHNEEKVKECSAVVVFQVLKNIEDFEKQIAENLPKTAVDYYEKLVKPQGEEYVKSWMTAQVYLALGIFLAACGEMEIDSTPMEGIMPEKYDEIIKNEKYRTLAAVAIGVKSDDDKNHPSKTPKKRLPHDRVLKEM